MRKYYVFLFSLLLLGCKEKSPEVVYDTAVPQLLCDEILTTMPGSLIVAGDYLVWENPFARDYFVHVHDKNGKEVGRMGRVGEGPEEFVTGGIGSHCVNNRFYAVDANGNTRGYLSIDSLVQNKKSFIPVSEEERKGRPRLKEWAEGVFIGRTEDDADHYFEANIHGERSTFGVYPIRKVKQHIGTYADYDHERGLYCCCSYEFPYLALYKKESNTFKLQWENKPDNPDYEIIEDRLVFDRKIGGMFAVCMSKDYIITLQRDRTKDPMDESTVGRNASKCPHTVFLYDYDGNLVKIVDLGMPVMRIAAARDANTLYAIGVNPDFVLAKYDL